MANLPVSPINADPANDVDPRPAGDPDPAGGQFLGGMNQGGCQPGLGVNTGELNPKAQDWPQVTINPLKYARIGWGGDSVETGQEDADIPDGVAADYAGADYNDTLAHVQADTAAAPGAVMDSVTGTVNRSDKTAVVGEWGWGTVPVA